MTVSGRPIIGLIVLFLGLRLAPFVEYDRDHWHEYTNSALPLACWDTHPSEGLIR